MLPAHALAELVTSQNFNILLPGTDFKRALRGFRTGFVFSVQQKEPAAAKPMPQGRDTRKIVSSVHSSAQESLMLPGIPRGPHLHTRGQHCVSPPHLSLCPLLTLSCWPSTCSDHPVTTSCTHQFLLCCGCGTVTLSASGPFPQASCRASTKAKRTSSAPTDF